MEELTDMEFQKYTFFEAVDKVEKIILLLKQLWPRHRYDHPKAEDICYACRAGKILEVKFGTAEETD